MIYTVYYSCCCCNCAWKSTVAVPVSVQVPYCYQNMSNSVTNWCCWHFYFLYWFWFYWVFHWHHNMPLKRSVHQFSINLSHALHNHNRRVHHHLYRMNRLINSSRHRKNYLCYPMNVFAVVVGGVIFLLAHSRDIHLMNSVTFKQA